MKSVEIDNIPDTYINALRKRMKYSNCYFTLDEVSKMVKEKNVMAYESIEAFVLIVIEQEIANIFYMSNSWMWLNFISVIDKFLYKKVVHIVKKGDLIEKNEFLNSGFRLYKEYIRLRKIGNECIEPHFDYRHASDEDYESIKKMIETSFEVIGDKIPSKEELIMFIAEKNIIVLEDSNIVQGFVIFEDKGKTSYIRMICVNKICRGMGIGKKLMLAYLFEHRHFTVFTLWYRTDNKIALQMYKQFGYSDDNLVDYIFLKEKEK